jgi:DNA-binding PadR family transcriptional regulator
MARGGADQVADDGAADRGLSRHADSERDTERDGEREQREQEQEHERDDLLDMPVTAYLVLGILSVLDEQLTAGEIKQRAEHSVGRFYWSPAVSHIRRELTRLLEFGLVATETVDVGARSMAVYESTPEGEAVLAKWASAIPEEDVMIKHPLMLKIWLADEQDLGATLLAIDRYLDRLQFQIDKAHWGGRRGRELGVTADDQTFPQFVRRYTIRALYSELANIRQLRDELAWRYSADPPRQLGLRTTQLRRRTHPGHSD